MSPWRSLRGRLAGSMALVLLLAIGVAASLDEAGRRLQAPLQRVPVLRALTREPYQDDLVLALGGIVLLALAWLVGTWSLRPLSRASDEARLVGPGDTGRRLTRAGLPAEVTPLVDAVNGALDRMAEAVEIERRFTEDAAHELRTPLAVLRLRLQRARQSAPEVTVGQLDWPAIERDVAELERLARRLLGLARRGIGETGAAPFDLCRVAREAAAAVLPLAEAQHRCLQVDLPTALPVRGNAEDVREAVVNVLENALVHGRGTVRLHGTTRSADGARQAVLVVGDEGDGIDSGLTAEAAFARFRKGPRSTGSGLGLAIVRDTMRRYGGEAAFLSGRPCRVELALPDAEESLLF